MNRLNLLLGTIIVFLFIVIIMMNEELKANRVYSRELMNMMSEDEPLIIWNDDIESIPKEGELVRLEMYKNGCVFIGPAE